MNYHTKVVGPQTSGGTKILNPKVKIFHKGTTYHFVYDGSLDPLVVADARTKIENCLRLSGGNFRSLPPGWRLTHNAG